MPVTTLDLLFDAALAVNILESASNSLFDAAKGEPSLDTVALREHAFAYIDAVLGGRDRRGARADFGRLADAHATNHFGDERHVDPSNYVRFLAGSDAPAPIRNVADFLTAKNFWPMITNTDILIPAMVNFFGGGALHASTRQAYPGRYRYYQRSSRYGGRNVAVSEFIIRRERKTPQPPTFLDVSNLSKAKPPDTQGERFTGVLFEQGDNQIITLRETVRFGPNFMLVTGDDQVPTGNTNDQGDHILQARIIFGRLLKVSRHDKRRHQSNWFVERIVKGEDPRVGVYDLDVPDQRQQLSDEACHFLFEQTVVTED